jgi:hypothetical protein
MAHPRTQHKKSQQKLIINILILAQTTVLYTACTSNSTTNNPTTYNNGIAQLIHQKCANCHNPNLISNYPLTTYAQVKDKAQAIKYVIEKNIMPPWPANQHYRQFKNQLTLTQAQKQSIINWINQNCPQGTGLQPTYIYTSTTHTYQNQEPYLSLPLTHIKIDSNYTDKFLLLKVPYQIPDTLYVKTIEFVPGNKKMVHHVNGDLIKYQTHKKQNPNTGQYYYNTQTDSISIQQAYQKMQLLHDDGSYPTLQKSVVNYLPGVIAQSYQNNIGGFILPPKGAFLLNDIHYGPSSTNFWDSSYINIFTTPTKPTRPLAEFQLGTLGIAPITPPLIIPPNKISTFTTQYTLPQTISLVTLNPHMHLLGKSFIAFAITPAADTIPLIHIPKWDFNWQFFYTFKKLLVLPKGTTIIAQATFDNTSQNPYNPNTPPKTITERKGSMRTTDEMFQLIINYLPYQNGDENLDL